MRVFGLGMPELIVILAVTLIFFGPKALPKLGSIFGRGIRKLRSRAGDGFDDGNAAERPYLSE